MKILLASLVGALVFGVLIFFTVTIATESTSSGSNTPNGVIPGRPLPAGASASPAGG